MSYSDVLCVYSEMVTYDVCKCEHCIVYCGHCYPFTGIQDVYKLSANYSVLPMSIRLCRLTVMISMYQTSMKVCVCVCV